MFRYAWVARDFIESWTRTYLHYKCRQGAHNEESLLKTVVRRPVKCEFDDDGNDCDDVSDLASGWSVTPRWVCSPVARVLLKASTVILTVLQTSIKSGVHGSRDHQKVGQATVRVRSSPPCPKAGKCRTSPNVAVLSRLCHVSCSSRSLCYC